LTSPGTRFVDEFANATNRPSLEIAGDRNENPFPICPELDVLTRLVELPGVWAMAM
jgi:hypothetical protein